MSSESRAIVAEFTARRAEDSRQHTTNIHNADFVERFRKHRAIGHVLTDSIIRTGFSNAPTRRDVASNVSAIPQAR
jgi:hypothetical protein